jgi:hypothetical protein
VNRGVQAAADLVAVDRLKVVWKKTLPVHFSFLRTVRNKNTVVEGGLISGPFPSIRPI